jgi:hypothetical protein
MKQPSFSNLILLGNNSFLKGKIYQFRSKNTRQIIPHIRHFEIEILDMKMIHQSSLQDLLFQIKMIVQ